MAPAGGRSDADPDDLLLAGSTSCRRWTTLLASLLTLGVAAGLWTVAAELGRGGVAEFVGVVALLMLAAGASLLASAGLVSPRGYQMTVDGVVLTRGRGRTQDRRFVPWASLVRVEVVPARGGLWRPVVTERGLPHDTPLPGDLLDDHGWNTLRDRLLKEVLPRHPHLRVGRPAVDGILR